VVTDEWRKVEVIRYKGGGPVFKHWALYVADKDENKPGFVCNVEGSRTRFRYVCKRTDPANSNTLIDRYQVGYVDTDNLKKFKDFAKAKKIKNEDEYWNCQDWVWEMCKS